LTNPKILTLDIETRPATAYVWGLFDQNISLSQLITPSAPICFAAKFVGDKKMYFASDWDDGHEGMIQLAHDLISEADAVVGYNSDGFDLKKLRGEFLLAGLPPPPPVTSIDLLKSVKKLGFQSNKLAYVGPMLKIGQKVKNEGFDLWSAVIDGDKAAQRRMKEYNIGDVVLTERLYLELLPYITNHPHLGERDSQACGACGSHDVQSRGYRRTKAFKIQRLHCMECGSWSDGKREKVG
jgi:hypothetical protein